MHSSTRYLLCLIFFVGACNDNSTASNDGGNVAKDGNLMKVGDADPVKNGGDGGMNQNCSGCHGNTSSSAPPNALNGDWETRDRGVGSHRNHLNRNPSWHRVVKCEDCHVVPSEINQEGHIDGDNVAELVFSAIAQTKGATPIWDGERCSNAYCHGVTLSGGTVTEPTWTMVDGSQDTCGSCHGLPPTDSHPDLDDCGLCHPSMAPGPFDLANPVFLDPASHINGIVEVNDGATCDDCHGEGGISAPPKDLAGNTSRTIASVGAHRQHRGASSWHRKVRCSDCHLVPSMTDSPGHLGADDQAEVIFDELNPNAGYNFNNGNCTNLYCHSNARNTSKTMTFTDDLVLDCTSCHAITGGNDGLGGRHQFHFDQGFTCEACHFNVADSVLGFVNPTLHIDGNTDVVFDQGGRWNSNTGRCSNLACHSNRTW